MPALQAAAQPTHAGACVVLCCSAHGTSSSALLDEQQPVTATLSACRPATLHRCMLTVNTAAFTACTLASTCFKKQPACQHTSVHLPKPPAGMSSTFATCSTVLRFYWFTFAFVTVTLIGLMSATISRWGLHYARNFVSCLVTICTVLMVIASEAFTGYVTVYDSLGLSDSWWHALFRTACAGANMAVVFLMLLLMAVGTE